MANEYDALVDEQPEAAALAAPANPYAALIEADESARTQRATGVLSATADVNPDQYATRRRVAGYLGYPPEAVEADPEGMARQARLKEIGADTAAAPVLQRRYGDQDFAKLAHDDSKVLATIETQIAKAARYVVSADDSGGLARDAVAGVLQLNRGAAGLARAPLEFGEQALSGLVGTVLPANPLSPVVQYLRGEAAASDRLAKSIAPPDASIIGGGVSAGVQSLSQNAPGLALALAGGPVGAGVGLLSMVLPVFGQSYEDARAKGLSPAQSAVFGASQAVVEYATEKIPLNRLIGDVVVGSPVLKTITRQLAAELPGEQVATVLQDLNEWAALNPEKPFTSYLEERPGAAAQTFIATLIGVGGNVAIVKAIENAAGQALDRGERVRQAEGDAQRFEQLFGIAASSKLQERSPETMRDFVQAVAEGSAGAPTELYIDARVLADTLQQSGIDPAELAQRMPSVLAQLQDADATGGTVVVPVGELVAGVTGTGMEQAFAQNLRTAPDALSQVEAKQAADTAQAFLQDSAARVIQQAQDASAAQASADAVKVSVLEQLTSANRFTADVNDAYASLVRDFYTVTGARLGLPAQEVFQRYPLQVLAQSPLQGGQLAQADRVRPEMRRLAEAAIAEGNDNHTVEMFPVSSEGIAEALEKAGLDLNGYRHTADMFSVRHALNRHSDPAVEQSRGQLPLTPADAEMIPEVIEAPDARIYGAVTPRKQQIVASVKRLPDGSMLVVEEVRTGRKALALASFRKYPAARDFGSIAETLLSNAQSDGGDRLIVVEQGGSRGAQASALATWFGKDSTLRNADGSPMELFHGTTEDAAQSITAFQRSTSGAMGSAVYLGDSPEASAAYDQGAMLKVYARGKYLDNMQWTTYIREHGWEGAEAAAKADGWAGVHDTMFENAVAVWDPSNIKSATDNSGAFDESKASIFEQGTGARGTFSPSSLTISLLENADLSTFLHETGHFFLEVTADLAAQPDAPAAVRADMETLLKWFGVADLSTWNNMTLDEQRPHHEKFAASFEQYLFEGKAPNRELRPLFQRFRSWLTNVYKSLVDFMRSHDTQLSPEVRGVFDRLLATDQQIAEAERDAGMLPDPEATGEAIDRLQARSLRDLKWTVNARSREMKKIAKDVAEKRKVVQTEVTAEIQQQPEFAAQRWLKTGVLPDGTETVGAKLSAPALAEMYGDGPATPRRYLSTDMVAAADGLHPDVVAEMFGYDSGDSLVRAIVAAGTETAAVDRLTDQRMLERFGDLTTPAGVAAAANEAIHNEARGRFIADELKALQEGADTPLHAVVDKAVDQQEKARTAENRKAIKAGSSRTLVEAAKQFGRDLVARRKIRDLRAREHEAAEARAARQAEQLLAAGKTQEAIIAKRDQLLSHFAARYTLDARAEIEKKLDYLKKFEGQTTLPADYQDQIDQLLERVDLRRSTTARELDRRASLLAWVETQREQGLEPDIPEHLLNAAQLTSYKDMTVEEFRGLVDTVKQIEHLGRLKKKLLSAKDQREFDSVREEMAASIIANAGDRQADTRTPNTVLGQALNGLKRFWASHIKAATWARIMDGGKDGGPVWEYLIRSANDAGNREVEMRAKATTDLSKLLAPVLKRGRMGGKGTYFDSIKRSLNREAVLAIALNTGNEGNLQRLLGGEGWTIQQLQPVLDSLSQEDWQSVQEVWDYIESFRPEIAAKERRVYGKEPAWVVPGSDVTRTRGVKGGYYPIKYDPRASERAESQADAEAAKRQLQGAYTSATTRRSFTKTRAEEVTGRPLLYALDGIYNGVQDVIHDLAWHEWLIDANRLVRNKAISSAMREHYGPDAHQQFKAWIQDVAEGERGAQNAAEASLAWVRQGVSIAGLGFNVMSAMIQPLGLTQSIVRVGPEWVARGVTKMIGSPIETYAEIASKSSFMENRARTRLRELAEVRSQVKGQGTFRRGIDTMAYTMMLRMQQVVDVPTWWGAYEKAIAGGNAEDRAIALADQAVIDAQGSGTTKDQSAIERGGPAIKLFTTFYSFFNTALNVGVTQTMTRESRAKLAADYLLLYTVPVVLGYFLKHALTPGDSGDDDDPRKLAKKLAGEQISYLMGLMFGVREFTGAAQAATGTAQFGNDYSGPAGVRLIGDATKAGKQVSQGELDEGLRKAVVNLAGDLLRLPSAQINRTVTGIEALREGKTKNPAAVVFGYEEPK